MLLYHVPDQLWDHVQPDSLTPLAEAMNDYTLFEPRVWRHVRLDGTFQQFLASALYQIVRQVRSDPGICDGDYPSFEMDWRRSLASRLTSTLAKQPVALCPSIHRVIPVGVSSADALQAMQGAIPRDLQDPYAITVQSSAVDERCGSIAITQPLHHTVVHINCMVNSALLVDVCRELRTGHRSVVSEVHSVSKKLSEMQQETNRQMSLMNTLVTTLMKKVEGKNMGVPDEDEPNICTKNRCSRVITKRFRSGKLQKQCSTCLSHTIKRR
jgi:hypothetical protein